MRWADIPRNPTTRTLRQFGGLCLVVFGGLGAWRWLNSGVSARVVVLVGVAVLAGLFALLAPRVLRPIFVGWMVVAFPMGWLVSRLALILVFAVFITPFALFFRLTGRDLLMLRRRAQTTYWKAKPSAPDALSYFRQS